MQDFALHLLAAFPKGSFIEAQLRLQFGGQLVGLSFCKVVQVGKNPVFHLLGAFVGKRNSQNVPEVMGAVFQRKLQVLLRKGAGLS